MGKIKKTEKTSYALAQVEDNLTSTSTTNAGSANQLRVLNKKIEKLEGTVLYESDEGNNGNVTLNDSKQNYRLFKIYGFAITFNVNVYSEYLVEEGRDLCLSCQSPNVNQVRLNTQSYEVTDNKLVLKNNMQVCIFNSTVSEQRTDRVEIYITKVVGYE